MTSEVGVRGQAHYALCEAADKGLASSLSPPPLHTHLLLRNCHQTKERGIAWLILSSKLFLSG